MRLDDKQKVRIWWIDDDHIETKGNKANVLKQMKRDPLLDIEGLIPQMLESKLQSEKKVANSEPDLFLVDYKLYAKKDNAGKKFPYTGNAIAGILKDRFPEHPIYLVSLLIDSERIREQIKRETELFDEVLMYKELTKEKDRKRLVYDAQDFRRIRKENDRSNVEAINDLLCVPKTSRERLEEALPKEFKNGIGAGTILSGTGELITGFSGVIRFTRWIKRELLRLPGVLYDDLYAATYLGVSEKYFKDKIVKRVLTTQSSKNPQYLGVFHRTSNLLWWKATLTALIYSLPESKDYAVSKVWEDAPKILKVSEKSRARCFVCNDFLPETVGYDPDDHETRAPVHWRCSEADPASEALPPFEQRRLLSERHV